MMCTYFSRDGVLIGKIVCRNPKGQPRAVHLRGSSLQMANH